MPKLNNPRAILESKIREFVFPYLESLDFVECPSRERTMGGASKTTYPFGTWTRNNSDGSVDLIDFKFDKYSKAEFEFDFAHISENGGYGSYQIHPQNDALAYGTGEFGRYRPKALTTFNPTSLAFSRRHLANEAYADKAIRKWMKGLQQVEFWFRSRTVGPYLITRENLPRGVMITRGRPSAIIFKTSYISFSPSTKGQFFGENNVKNYDEALSVAKDYYADAGKTLNLSKQVWWKFDGL